MATGTLPCRESDVLKIEDPAKREPSRSHFTTRRRSAMTADELLDKISHARAILCRGKRVSRASSHRCALTTTAQWPKRSCFEASSRRKAFTCTSLSRCPVRASTRSRDDGGCCFLAMGTRGYGAARNTASTFHELRTWRQEYLPQRQAADSAAHGAFVRVCLIVAALRTRLCAGSHGAASLSTRRGASCSGRTC